MYLQNKTSHFWREEPATTSCWMKSCRHNVTTFFFFFFFYYTLLLCGKLLVPCAAWNQIVVVHGMMATELLLTVFFVKTTWATPVAPLLNFHQSSCLRSVCFPRILATPETSNYLLITVSANPSIRCNEQFKYRVFGDSATCKLYQNYCTTNLLGNVLTCWIPTSNPLLSRNQEFNSLKEGSGGSKIIFIL